MSNVSISLEYNDFSYLLHFSDKVCIQSGTQQAYVLTLNCGIEKDNLNNTYIT